MSQITIEFSLAKATGSQSKLYEQAQKGPHTFFLLGAEYRVTNINLSDTPNDKMVLIGAEQIVSEQP